MSKPVRVRIAPSPTGALHIGRARTALFNWAYARATAASSSCASRTPTPSARTKEHERRDRRGLRVARHRVGRGPGRRRTLRAVPAVASVSRGTSRAARRRSSSRATPTAASARTSASSACARSRRRARSVRSTTGCAPRPRSRGDRAPSWPRAELRGPLPRAARVRRWRRPHPRRRALRARGGRRLGDGARRRQPDLQLLVVCDDIDMRITHVLRGEEHLVNTPKQVLLYRALAPPAAALRPPAADARHRRQEALEAHRRHVAQDYRDNGYPREAIVNFLCLQGWALDGATELFGVEQLVARFDVARRAEGRRDLRPRQVPLDGRRVHPPRAARARGRARARRSSSRRGSLSAEELSRGAPGSCDVVADRAGAHPASTASCRRASPTCSSPTTRSCSTTRAAEARARKHAAARR